MLGLIIVITTLEHIFVVPFMPPHVKPGFANIVIMFCVFGIGRRQAFTLNMLKSLFVLITRGAIGGLLSLSGGLLSIAVIILLASVKKKQASYIGISVTGALFHNLGQFIIFMLLMATPALIYYAPMLVVSGVISGVITGILLKVLMPALKRFHIGGLL
ncbi:MAG: Gx transporter family protein [Defluviitaleaceae bacterium]|nr:Gx transporter family protein [Defluviitaleaceae bacterium]